jgi:F-type H+-transporting ATPase subunit epsilon
MASTTEFALITPREVKFEGKVEIVVAPGAAGDLAALPNHAPMLTMLRVGVLRATVAGATAGDASHGGRRLEYAVDGGFLQILPDKVVVLTDVALGSSEIDADAARADLRRAEEGLTSAQGGDDSIHRRAISWATARLEVAHKLHV